ncbi:MAG: hypothetical protein IIC22_04260 [Chloroflexi bacterium]|nr:hypothetical protein [Chloroflexota bacterium]
MLEAPTTRLPVAIHLPVVDEKTHQPKFSGTYSPHPTKEGYLIKVSDEGDGPSTTPQLWVITTNDNLNALRFYQMWGMTIAALRPNALEESRKLKPEIPMTGIDNIPLHDEIELELAL